MAWADFPDARQSIGLLRRSLERGRLGHAYLFGGDDADLLEGVAGELAMTVNCGGAMALAGGTRDSAAATGTTVVDACGACSSCRRVRSGLHPDVYWLRAESKSRIIRVEQVRELIHAVQLKPTEARYKVGILAGAERLTAQAANAFLKTLEEPPRQSLLILLSTEPDRLLETIQSRCLRLTFPGKPPLEERQVEWLKAFTAQASQPGRSLLSRYRWLDGLLQRLGDLRDEAEKWVESRAPSTTGVEVDSDLREQWDEEAKAATEAEYRRRRAETLGLLESWLRDVWITTLGQPQTLLVHPDLADATRTVAGRLSPAQALDNVRFLEETQSILHTNVQEALALEVALLRLRL